MAIGIVKSFNNSKGFGFIEHAGGDAIFLHHSAIQPSGTNLVEGQTVEFDVTTGRNGLVAKNVRISDAALRTDVAPSFICRRYDPWGAVDKAMDQFELRDWAAWWRRKGEDYSQLMRRAQGETNVGEKAVLYLIALERLGLGARVSYEGDNPVARDFRSLLDCLRALKDKVDLRSIEDSILFPLETRTFQAGSLEEARRQTESIPAEKIYDVLEWEASRRGAEADGESAPAALLAARQAIPSEALAIEPGHIIKEGDSGLVEVQAHTDHEAEALLRAKLPAGVAYGLSTMKCLLPPKKGLVGIGKSAGQWQLRWSIPFRARVEYQLPARVTIRYQGAEPESLLG